MKKKLIALLLTLVMLLNMAPGVTVADEAGHDHADAVCTDAGCDDHDHAVLTAVPRSGDCTHTNVSDWEPYDGTQHCQYCQDCGETLFADHTGGKATCTVRAICEVCGGGYGNYDDNNHNWGSWGQIDGSTHVRVCLDCHVEEEGSHYGGDGSCKPVCEGCGEKYTDVNGRHINMGTWLPYSNAQHFSQCQDCSVYLAYADHTDLNNDGQCDDCSYTMPVSCTHANMSTWHYTSDTQHYRFCLDCGEYKETADHNWDDWTWINASVHVRVCLDCRAEEKGSHSGGDGSCAPTCDVCGGPYIDINGRHINMGDWFSYSDAQHYRICLDCVEYVEYAGHTDLDGAGLCDDCGHPMPTSCTHASMTIWQPYSPTQHYRYCWNCGPDVYTEYGEHTGGTATCVLQAICEGCGAGYGEYDTTNHADLSGWESISETQHRRWCQNCGNYYEYGEHYGGDGSCLPNCEGCGQMYHDPNGQHKNTTDWAYYDSTQHWRSCQDCLGDEYADHTGGDGSCTPTCEVCGDPYIDPNGKHSAMTGWRYENETQHYRLCETCWTNESIEYGEHTGGDGSCKPTCEGCGWLYHDPNGQHNNLSEWMVYDHTQHWRHCYDCSFEELADHTGGTATCKVQASCEGCGISYGETDPDNHNWGEWKLRSESIHYRECINCPAEEEGSHYGGDGSCMPTCEGCGWQHYDATSTKHAGMSEWDYYDSTQHSRYCQSCYSEDSWEYAAHTGGDGSCMPTCEVCDRQHTDANGQHKNMSDWERDSDTQHYRYCLDCYSFDSYEYATHTGGDGTCSPICEGCGEQYTDATSTKHLGMSEWLPYSATQHYRLCLACVSEATREYADHTGGDGSCKPICEGCGEQYTDVNGQHNNMTDWDYYSATQHYRYCQDCFEYGEYGDHTSGDATCILSAECEVCGEQYYNEASAKHVNTSIWYPYSDTQHYRYCLDCGSEASHEYGDHTGSPATCSTYAKCEVCGMEYGELGTEHTNISGWVPYSETQHFRYCQDCDSAASREYGDHTGGDGSCMPICEVCGQVYSDGNGRHNSVSDWKPYSDTQHVRYCTDCKSEDTYEYADHTGGTTTCYSAAECEVCGAEYGVPNTERANMSEWIFDNETQHFRYCLDCGHVDSYEYAAHTGGTATCISYAECEACGEDYGVFDPDKHTDMSEWFPYSDAQHFRYCQDCGSDASHEYADHTGGTATCVSYAECEVCDADYGEFDPDKHTNITSWKDYNETQHYRYCDDCGSDETIQVADHTDIDGNGRCDDCYSNIPCKHVSMSVWYYANDTQHRRWCLDCGAYESNEYEDHYGGTATCAVRAVCEGCGEEYGGFSTEHLWSEWGSFSGSEHVRYCTDPVCNASEIAGHTGGDGSCMPACEGCGDIYMDHSGEHLGLRDWTILDDTQHYRWCLDCGGAMEFGGHTGGDDSCRPTCELCGEKYSNVNGRHNISQWISTGTAQHFRDCIDCRASDTYEYEDHYGGAATCNSYAKCEGCSGNYGELDPDNHIAMSDWALYDSTQHWRQCLDCGKYKEYGEHTGDDGSCMPTCEVCGEKYYNSTGEHRNMFDWKRFDETQHYRSCLDCENYKEYGNHTGSPATCVDHAFCEVCSAHCGELDPDNHTDIADWVSYDNAQHVRLCLSCGTYAAFADHTGGDGSCTPTCEVCGEQYYDANGEHRNMTEWIQASDKQHYRNCLDCDEHKEYADHTGGDGSCKSNCEACGRLYYNVNGEHRNKSGWLLFDAAQHYRICLDCGRENSLEYDGHTGGDDSCKPTCEECGEQYTDVNGQHLRMSPWVPHNATQHTRSCADCNSEESVEIADHTGGTADCIYPAFCEECGDIYGELGEHAWGEWNSNGDGTHTRICKNDATHTETDNCTGGAATCTEVGVCEVCDAAYISAVNHSWGEWKPNGDGTHTRICKNDATHTETDDCTGGTATCTEVGVCEVCDESYGNPDPDNHTFMSDWMPASNGQHFRLCIDCTSPDSYEYEDHHGGDGSCMPTCEVCEEQYFDESGTHNNMTDWRPYNDTQHFRYCQDCYFNSGSDSSVEYEAHYGGDGSCRPTCEGCGAQYEDPNGQHNNISDWASYTDTQHYRRCMDCNSDATYEYADHTGGTATCVLLAECEVCGEEYGELNNDKHTTMTNWRPMSDTQHFCFCMDCGSLKSEEYGEHTGGTATCTEDGVCEVCEAVYISAINHSWGEWTSNGDDTHTRVCANDATHTETDDCTGGTATCTEDGVCEVCDAAYIPAIQHSWGEWKSNGDGTHTRVCANDATHTETEDCTGGTATCTANAICEVCGSEHEAAFSHIPGAEADCTNDQVCTREGCGELLAEKLGHDYTAVVTKPTCTEPGYTTYTCSRCEDSYQADQTAARGHWYDLWYPNQDGKHSAECKRYGCSHEGTAECTLYEVTVKDGETETILTVCPVCGDHERATFGVVSGAVIKNVYIDHPLPRGEQLVRELDAPFDGVLYAFTAAYESAGRVVPFNGKVSVSLPLDVEKYAGFKLVRVDVTPATETTERTEVWTDVAFTFENGRLTFETDVAGLFLLVPIE